MPAVRLRPREERDRDVLFAHQADPASAAMAEVAPRDRAAFDAHWDAPDPSARHWVVEAGGEVVGEVLTFVRDGEREVGYRIAREHWGGGLASAALPELLALVDERPLAARVAAHNGASLRVLEKAGFARVGERREGGVDLVLLRLG